MRRKDREMPEKRALELVDSTMWTVLSLVDPQGNPYGVPLNITRKGNFIYFHGATAGLKLDCLRKNPIVSLTFVGNSQLEPSKFTTLYQSAIVRGTATEVVETEEKVSALKSLAEKFAISHIEKLQEELDGYLRHTSVWKIEISSITGKENK